MGQRREHEAVCPWCGNRHPRRYRLHNGRPYLWTFRVAKHKVAIKHSAKSLRRYGIMAYTGRPYMRGPTSRTWAVCAHPFHDQIDDSGWPEVTPTLPPRVHNPDLAEDKRALKRALQGKERR